MKDCAQWKQVLALTKKIRRETLSLVPSAHTGQ